MYLKIFLGNSAELVEIIRYRNKSYWEPSETLLQDLGFTVVQMHENCVVSVADGVTWYYSRLMLCQMLGNCSMAEANCENRQKLEN